MEELGLEPWSNSQLQILPATVPAASPEREAEETSMELEARDQRQDSDVQLIKKKDM